MSMERGDSPEEGSIVDMLLADVRSGFCNRKYTEGNFNVTKVQKISLDPKSLAAALSSGTGDAVSTHDAALSKAGAGGEAAEMVRGGHGRVSHRKKKLEGSGDRLDPPSMDTSSDSVGSDSLTQRRSRKSYATEDDASLIEFLMDSELEKDPPKPETTFDRYASLRRRRQERRDRKKLLDVVTPDRERAPSPVINSDGRLSAPATPTEGPGKLASAKEEGSGGSRALRRTRSWLDRPSVDKALADSKAAAASSEDETDALVARLKSRLNRGDREHGHHHQRDSAATPPILEESPPARKHSSSSSSSSSSTTTITTTTTPSHTLSPHSSNSSTPHGRGDVPRWRSSVGSVEHHHLETISEKDTATATTTTTTTTTATDNLQGVRTVPNGNVTPDSAHSGETAKPDTAVSGEVSLEKSRRQLKQRYSTLDPKQLNKLLGGDMLEKGVNGGTQEDSGPPVTVSVRKAMSDKMGTNVDGLLKTIEDSDRPIDKFGVICPSVRQQQQPTETVTAMVAADSKGPDSSAGETAELKQKREMRKKRSKVSSDDVMAALRDKPTKPAKDHANTAINVSSKARSPPSHRRTLSNGDKSPATDGEKHKPGKDKQAAKKNFRDARFGYKDMKSVAELNGRTRSDVERQDVDQALRDLVNKGSMSRSKSYDESVARRAGSEAEKTMRNSGSNPDTTEEKRSLLRGHSSHRLSMDGRRNGLYIPSDDSDTELRPEDTSRARRSSHRSHQSANTSTETLQADKESDAGDSSPEQRRRSYGRDGEGLERSSTITPSSTRPSSASSVDGERAARRSYSHLDHKAVETAVNRLQSKADQLDDDDNPMASVAKWRLKRTKRLSVHENIMDTSSSSGRTAGGDPHLLGGKGEVADYRNEVGSRSSYASSYASSTDTDQGFESMGNVSQRTSLSSTLESEIASTPTMGRKADVSQRTKHDSGLGDTDTPTSSLPEEASRQLR